jgi:hypothetical protein
MDNMDKKRHYDWHDVADPEKPPSPQDFSNLMRWLEDKALEGYVYAFKLGEHIVVQRRVLE